MDRLATIDGWAGFQKSKRAVVRPCKHCPRKHRCLPSSHPLVGSTRPPAPPHPLHSWLLAGQQVKEGVSKEQQRRERILRLMQGGRPNSSTSSGRRRRGRRRKGGPMAFQHDMSRLSSAKENARCWPAGHLAAAIQQETGTVSTSRLVSLAGHLCVMWLNLQKGVLCLWVVGCLLACHLASCVCCWPRQGGLLASPCCCAMRKPANRACSAEGSSCAAGTAGGAGMALYTVEKKREQLWAVNQVEGEDGNRGWCWK